MEDFVGDFAKGLYFVMDSARDFYSVIGLVSYLCLSSNSYYTDPLYSLSCFYFKSLLHLKVDFHYFTSSLFYLSYPYFMSSLYSTFGGLYDMNFLYLS